MDEPVCAMSHLCVCKAIAGAAVGMDIAPKHRAERAAHVSARPSVLCLSVRSRVMIRGTRTSA